MKNLILALISILLFSFKNPNELQTVKYFDLTSEKITQEVFENNDEFKNRIYELNYLNNDFIKIIEIKKTKNNVVFKFGGEGAGN